MKLIKEIITDADKIRYRSDEVDPIADNELIRTITKSLKDTMEANGLVSLSAPQIGFNKRIFCVKFDVEIKTFIDPIIISREGLTPFREKCHSIPDKEFIIPRNNKVTVLYTRPNKSMESREFVGLGAAIIQHCIDHLDGCLVSDIGLEIDDLWDKATEEERQEVLNDYLDSLDLKRKEVQEEINNDDLLKKTYDAIDFMEKVYKGEVELAKPEEPKE